MMFDSEFEALTSSDQQTFKSTVSSLLTHTYILRGVYDFSRTNIRKNNDEYNFALRNLDLIREYLSFAGYNVSNDEHYGIIYLSSFPDGTRVHFDKMTTLIVYALRLIYEEERAKLTLGTEVPYTVLDLNQKLIALGITRDGRPLAESVLSSSLSRIARFRLVAKEQGQWGDVKTHFVILPSILLAIDKEKLEDLDDLLSEKSRDADAADEEAFE